MFRGGYWRRRSEKKTTPARPLTAAQHTHLTHQGTHARPSLDANSLPLGATRTAEETDSIKGLAPPLPSLSSSVPRPQRAHTDTAAAMQRQAASLLARVAMQQEAACCSSSSSAGGRFFLQSCSPLSLANRSGLALEGFPLVAHPRLHPPVSARPLPRAVRAVREGKQWARGGRKETRDGERAHR